MHTTVPAIFVLPFLALIAGRTIRQHEASTNFVGEGTNDLSISILQVEAENCSNLVFSPLGYSAILAILAEGARGNTRNQLVAALKLPEDTFAVRNTYKSVLFNLQEHGVINKPEFKNWFYVYKNYTVEQTFKTILSENYFTNVKEIENDYYYNSSEEKLEENSDKIKDSPTTTEKEQIKEKEPSKEQPVTDKNKETKIEEENKELVKEIKEQNIINPIVEEVVARTLNNDLQIEKEMLTALSANRLSSVDDSVSEDKATSQMIIFNALYFRGNWSAPFSSKKEKMGTFYTSESEKVQVEVIHSEGEFEFGRIPDLEASAIELPYQGERYSLLIVVPDSRDGLLKLTSSLTGYSFRDISKHLTRRTVEVCLPKFKFYSITRPKKALTERGVSDIFNEAADLSGITGTKGLYLNDLVQLVTLEVNESSGSYNFLTSSSIAETRTVYEKFTANQPFLFFLRDRVDNLIVVAGKVHNPKLPEDEHIKS